MGRFTDFIQLTDSSSDLTVDQKIPQIQETEADKNKIPEVTPTPSTSSRTWKNRKKK
jgi:hypothetical protein